jgi:hypothetical protein
MDRVLHGERIAADRGKAVFEAALETLPDGAMIRDLAGSQTYLVAGQRLFPWTFAGYGPQQSRAGHTRVAVLTPATIVAVLSAGYRPILHPTAGIGLSD